MKKVFCMICLSALTLAAQSCDPMKDTYTILDNTTVDQSGVQEVELSLTATEYKLLDKVEGAEEIQANESFASEDLAKEFIPVILQKKYPLSGGEICSLGGV